MCKDSWTSLQVGRNPLRQDGMRLNWGGRSRKQTTQISVTVLGNPDMSIAWPQRERVGLIFKNGINPVTFIEDLLRKAGFRSTEELRQRFEIPQCMLTCRTIRGDAQGLVQADTAGADTVLRQALLLGLCGSGFYDPNKAVIWTNNRLSRKLDLFEPGRFYADN